MNRINLDRPYICKEDSTAGPRAFPIYMYKDEPGVYRKQNGEKADDADASAAGFNVSEDRLLSRMNSKKADALKEIEAEFEGRKDEIEKEAVKEIAAEDEAERLSKSKGEQPETKPPENSMPADGVIKNSQGEPRETAMRKMNHIGAGSWEVIDKRTGDTIKDGLDKDHAQILLMEI